jgi:hypothetical protein
MRAFLTSVAAAVLIAVVAAVALNSLNWSSAATSSSQASVRLN